MAPESLRPSSDAGFLKDGIRLLQYDYAVKIAELRVSGRLRGIARTAPAHAAPQSAETLRRRGRIDKGSDCRRRSQRNAGNAQFHDRARHPDGLLDGSICPECCCLLRSATAGRRRPSRRIPDRRSSTGHAQSGDLIYSAPGWSKPFATAGTLTRLLVTCGQGPARSPPYSISHFR